MLLLMVMMRFAVMLGIIVFLFFRWHKIKPAFMKRVAFRNTSDCEIASLQGAVCLYCFNPVCRTSRVKTTRRRGEPRNIFLIKSDSSDKNFFHYYSSSKISAYIQLTIFLKKEKEVSFCLFIKIHLEIK